MAGVVAMAIPGATPDVIARAASALESKPGQVIVYHAELRYGTDVDRSDGDVVRLEGMSASMVDSIGTRGDDMRGPSLGNRIPITEFTLSNIREVLEAARDGRSTNVEYVGETSVEAHAAYERRMTLDSGASRTLFIDRDNYLPIRFDQTGPGSQWAVLDFTRVRSVTTGHTDVSGAGRVAGLRR